MMSHDSREFERRFALKTRVRIRCLRTLALRIACTTYYVKIFGFVVLHDSAHLSIAVI